MEDKIDLVSTRLTVHPPTVVLDPKSLREVGCILATAQEGPLTQALTMLLAQANRWVELWLRDRPWTVTKKRYLPPSEDIHDYMSQALYWWPSDSPTSLPFILRDGEINPDSIKDDKAGLRKVFLSSYTLSMAWYYTKNDTYGTQASAILRAWFIDRDTMMNPHLRFAQCIPGVNTGRSIGIIDFSQSYTSVVDAAALLAFDCPAWSREDHDRFLHWNRIFLDWLLYSDFGVEESQRLNNHGNFATLLKAVIALFVGDRDVAMREVECMKTRISEVIASDGAQPFELGRTRSWHYSCYNLVALARMAEVSKRLGVDLWSHQGSEGQCLHTAVNYLIPAATGSDVWQHLEIEFRSYLATELIRASAMAGNAVAQAALHKLQAPPFGDLWGLRPVPENLDAYIQEAPYQA